jgi:hypothetical protein
MMSPTPWQLSETELEEMRAVVRVFVRRDAARLLEAGRQ